MGQHGIPLGSIPALDRVIPSKAGIQEGIGHSLCFGFPIKSGMTKIQGVKRKS